MTLYINFVLMRSVDHVVHIILCKTVHSIMFNVRIYCLQKPQEFFIQSVVYMYTT